MVLIDCKPIVIWNLIRRKKTGDLKTKTVHLKSVRSNIHWQSIKAVNDFNFNNFLVEHLLQTTYSVYSILCAWNLTMAIFCQNNYESSLTIRTSLLVL